VISVAFSPDGTRLASAGPDGKIQVHDARPLTPALRVEREAIGLVDALFAQHGLQAVVALRQYQGQGLDARGFSWWGGGSGFITYIGPNASDPDIMTGAWCDNVNPLNPPCATISTPPPSPFGRRQGARSRHLSGLNAAFSDGHISFITNTIAIGIWRALGTSHGGEVLNDSEL
jgi:prepilin-type processing-associated H-X9-DG protein